MKKLQITLKSFLKKKNKSIKKLGVDPPYKTITGEDRKKFDKWIKLLNNQQCINNLDPKFKVNIIKKKIINIILQVYYFFLYNHSIK